MFDSVVFEVGVLKVGAVASLSGHLSKLVVQQELRHLLSLVTGH